MNLLKEVVKGFVRELRQALNDNYATVLLDSLVTVAMCRRTGRHSMRGQGRHEAAPTLRWRLT